MKHACAGRWLLPDFVLFAGTRVTLGLGLGLLCSRRMNNDQRKAAGIALTAVSALVTIPLALRFAGYRRWRHEHGGCHCGCPHCGSGGGCDCPGDCPDCTCQKGASAVKEQQGQAPAQA